ncbi:MAG TPA: GNAT family protein [Aquabacterium sp.]|uniref:GNAT family N-acetyltransferase n=1 Tax=Aquabacterium sp. TaxID=1872578 RepID=UPI002E3309F9|nr:GNAT family protein [Aquabacterium sp.]HEX5356280.1 GNAT family protein [Aquabacterium sp.]
MDWPRLIDTPRLQLRDMRAGDAQDVFDRYASDPAVLRFLGWTRHETVEDTRQRISFDIYRWLKGSAWVWGLTMKAAHPQAGRVFGQIELVPMSFPSDEAHHLRLGYLMAPSHWGQGLMAEAAHAVLDAAFAQPRVWRVDALCDVDNQASAAMLARIGLAREGCMRRGVVHPNVSDEPRDAWVYAVSRDDWRSGHAGNNSGLA